MSCIQFWFYRLEEHNADSGFQVLSREVMLKYYENNFNFSGHRDINICMIVIASQTCWLYLLGSYITDITDKGDLAFKESCSDKCPEALPRWLLSGHTCF